jgi:hypothetical protein
MFFRNIAGNSFPASASMALFTSASTAAGSSSLRWPVTPMRKQYLFASD